MTSSTSSSAPVIILAVTIDVFRNKAEAKARKMAASVSSPF